MPRLIYLIIPEPTADTLIPERIILDVTPAVDRVSELCCAVFRSRKIQHFYYIASISDGFLHTARTDRQTDKHTDICP